MHYWSDQEQFAWVRELAADSILSIALWSILVQFVASIFFVTHHHHGAWLAICVFIFSSSITEVLAVQEHFRRWSGVWLAWSMSIGLLAHLLPWVEARVVVQAVSLASAFPVIFTTWSGTRKRRMRAVYGLLIGLSTLLCLRWSYFSLNPVFVSVLSVCFLTALVIGAGVVLVFEQWRDTQLKSSLDSDSEEEPIAYYYEKKKKAKTQRFKRLRKVVKNYGWVLSALGVGNLFFFTHYFFTGPSVPLRFVGSSPLNLSGFSDLAPVFAFSMGLLPTLISAILRGDVWFVMFGIGLGLLSFGNSTWGFIGGIFGAFALPGLWVIALEDLNLNVSTNNDTTKKCVTGRFGCLALISYAVLMIIATFTYKNLSSHRIFPLSSLIPQLFVALMFILGVCLLRILTGYLWIPTEKKNDEAYKDITLKMFIIFILLAMCAAITTHELLKANSVDVETEGITVMTWNLQQGFNSLGENDMLGVFQVVQGMANVIGLQDCDLARVTNANNDIIEFLATKLHMRSQRDTRSSREGKSSCGLLSKYRIKSSSQILLPGDGVLSVATVRVDSSHDMHVVVAHWQNEESQEQAEMTASYIAQLLGPVVVLGDFVSFNPDSLEITTLLEQGGLKDAFTDIHNSTAIVRVWNQPYILYRGMVPKHAFVLDTSWDFSGFAALVAQFEDLEHWVEG